MKGIILAGGKATRLYPTTLSISKQIIPIYDKPMIYYPISILMLANIRDILVISNPFHLDLFKDLLGNGERFGINFTYKKQLEPKGLADAFLIGEDFIGDDNVSLILGDNFIYGADLRKILSDAVNKIDNQKGAIIFSYNVKNPSAYGIVELDDNNNILSLEEKPKEPKSSMAVIGLYLFDNDVIKIAKKVKPSPRNELEITSINQEYLNLKKISLVQLNRGFSWFDAGTYDDIYDASTFVKTMVKSSNFQIACLEEIAFKNGWINKDNLRQSIKKLEYTEYGNYLKRYL